MACSYSDYIDKGSEICHMLSSLKMIKDSEIRIQNPEFSGAKTRDLPPYIVKGLTF